MTFEITITTLLALIAFALIFRDFIIGKALDQITKNQESQYKKLDFINTQIAGIWRGQDKIENNTAILSSIVDKMHRNLCSIILDEMVEQVEEVKRENDVYEEVRRLSAINTSSVCENMTKIQKELQKKGKQDDN